MYDNLKAFYKKKKVFITGHTGFKGAWMVSALLGMGAEVAGYALESPTNPSLFGVCGFEKEMRSELGDIRDLAHLEETMSEFDPDIVIHMAAQPLVRESYRKPIYTYETNVMGTVNVLECVRLQNNVKSFLNVTTDKVYLNRELGQAFTEDEPLDGYDPYSNSKSCSELVTHSYKSSFFDGSDVAISTARAGNVIGGGDFAKDRIVPDCVRAVEKGEPIIVRNPHSTRPYQHVLEPVMAYLLIAKRCYEDISLAGSYNVGPDESDCLTTGELADIFCTKWNEAASQDSSLKRASWLNRSDGGPHEASFLKLDSSKIKKTFGWKPTWDAEKAIEKTVEWTIDYFTGKSVRDTVAKQIEEYMRG